MNIKNKNYWDNYYNMKEHNADPLSFAQFIAKKFINKDTYILEVGSGDGRDTFYLRKKAKHILGVDLPNIIIKKNRLKSKRIGYKNINFKNLSSSQINKIQNKKINFIYARFFIHSINENNEDIFLKILSKKFEKKLKDLKFDILYKKFGINLSKTKNENPHLCRIVFTKMDKPKL